MRQPRRLARLCFLPLLLAASPRLGSPAGPAAARPEVLERDAEVKLALSAAPAHLRKGAGVYAFDKEGFVQVRPGTNGFTCIVNRDHPLSRKPTCYDAEGTATMPEVLVEPRGLPLGAHVPAFHATDQSGRPSSFESLVGPRGLVLLFVRSADW